MLSEPEARVELDEILRRLSVKAGDCIMLGIDMGKLPLPSYKAALNRAAYREREQRWCAFVLDVLLERLGPEGTLVAPAYTYSCGKPGSRFVAEETPAETGPFTEFVRTHQRSVRSLHPIFSLCAIGRDAGALLDNCGRSAFGAMSPFARFPAYNVRFLCLGVELRQSITYIHHLEQCYGCAHRFIKTFDTPVESKGVARTGDWYASVGYRGLGYTSDISLLQQSLAERDKLICTEWEKHPNQVADVSDVDSVGYDLLAADSMAFVNRRFSLRFDDHVDESSVDTGSCTVRITAEDTRR